MAKKKATKKTETSVGKHIRTFWKIFAAGIGIIILVFLPLAPFHPPPPQSPQPYWNFSPPLGAFLEVYPMKQVWKIQKKI